MISKMSIESAVDSARAVHITSNHHSTCHYARSHYTFDFQEAVREATDKIREGAQGTEFDSSLATAEVSLPRAYKVGEAHQSYQSRGLYTADLKGYRMILPYWEGIKYLARLLLHCILHCERPFVDWGNIRKGNLVRN